MQKWAFGNWNQKLSKNTYQSLLILFNFSFLSFFQIFCPRFLVYYSTCKYGEDNNLTLKINWALTLNQSQKCFWEKSKRFSNLLYFSGNSTETMRKLCLFTKFPYQKIGWNYGIVRVLFYLVTPILVVSLISSDPVPHRIIKGSRVDSNHLWLIPFLMLVIPFSRYFYLKHKSFHLLEASYISTGTEIIILRGRHPKVLYLEYRKFTYSKILS